MSDSEDRTLGFNPQLHEHRPAVATRSPRSVTAGKTVPSQEDSTSKTLSKSQKRRARQNQANKKTEALLSAQTRELNKIERYNKDYFERPSVLSNLNRTDYEKLQHKNKRTNPNGRVI